MREAVSNSFFGDVKNISRYAATLLLGLSFTTAAAETAHADIQQAEMNPALESEFSWLKQHYDNATQNCVPLRFADQVDNAASQQVQKLTAILERTEATGPTLPLVAPFRRDFGTICILDSKTDGFYNFDTKVIEIDEDLSEGAQVYTLAHELHSHLQVWHGFELRHTNWKFPDAVKFIEQTESDADVVATLKSAMLADPTITENTYPDALSALDDMSKYKKYAPGVAKILGDHDLGPERSQVACRLSATWHETVSTVYYTHMVIIPTYQHADKLDPNQRAQRIPMPKGTLSGLDTIHDDLAYFSVPGSDCSVPLSREQEASQAWRGLMASTPD